MQCDALKVFLHISQYTRMNFVCVCGRGGGGGAASLFLIMQSYVSYLSLSDII